jgi:hypothetical protein
MCNFFIDPNSGARICGKCAHLEKAEKLPPFMKEFFGKAGKK